MKVLIGEDHPDSLELFIRVLTCAGHEVLYTISGLEAMKIARQHLPDAILLDFNLPDIDGSQICLALRKLLKQTAMIAITSQGDRATRKKAEMFGFDAFIPKPINIPELLNVIERLGKRNAIKSA